MAEDPKFEDGGGVAEEGDGVAFHVVGDVLFAPGSMVDEGFSIDFFDDPRVGKLGVTGGKGEHRIGNESAAVAEDEVAIPELGLVELGCFPHLLVLFTEPFGVGVEVTVDVGVSTKPTEYKEETKLSDAVDAFHGFFGILL